MNKIPDNKKRHQLIRDLQFEMKEHWGFSEEETGIIATAMIGKIRKALEIGSFKEICYEIYEISCDGRKFQRKMNISSFFT